MHSVNWCAAINPRSGISCANSVATSCSQTTWLRTRFFMHGTSCTRSVARARLSAGCSKWHTRRFCSRRRKSNRYSEILEEVGQADRNDRVEESNEISDLDKFLAVLTEEERAVMILSYACGLSHREIGDAAELPIGTVKSIIFRGKEKIRESFDIEDHQYG